MNYTEMENAILALDQGVSKAVHCRSTLRSAICIKRFLDNIDDSNSGNLALALFSDLARAISKTVFPHDTQISGRSITELHAGAGLKMLIENDEAFASGYLAGSCALAQAFSKGRSISTASYYSQKYLELVATNFRPQLEERLKHLFQLIEVDISMAAQVQSPDLVFSMRELTLGGALPGEPRYQPYDLDLALKHAGGDWSFWREWYQGFLDGKPMDWELQRRVAMIPDEDWEKGPEHIARMIEEIRARFKLEKRLEALETEKLLWEAQGRHGLGGNNPPEQINDAAIQEFILEPIEVLKAETQEGVPDRSRVQAAITKLTAILVAGGKWTGGKLDMAVDECVKSMGKVAGPALLGWIGLNSDKFIEIVKLAKDWLAVW